MSRQWPDETPEEMVDRYADDPETAALVAKMLNAPFEQKRRRPVPKVVGVKPRHVSIPQTKGRGPDWRERAHINRTREGDFRVLRLLVPRREYLAPCHVCDEVMPAGVEVAVLYPSHRTVHATCAPKAVRARVAD